MDDSASLYHIYTKNRTVVHVRFDHLSLANLPIGGATSALLTTRIRPADSCFFRQQYPQPEKLQVTGTDFS